MTRVSVGLAAGLVLLSMAAAQAGTAVTDAKGMTLYGFDKDKGGVSACYDACAKAWPPALVDAKTKLGKGWTTVARKDGTQQLAYDGKPAYYFSGDQKAGESKGDGLQGVWHVLQQ